MDRRGQLGPGQRRLEGVIRTGPKPKRMRTAFTHDIGLPLPKLMKSEYQNRRGLPLQRAGARTLSYKLIWVSAAGMGEVFAIGLGSNWCWVDLGQLGLTISHRAAVATNYPYRASQSHTIQPADARLNALRYKAKSLRLLVPARGFEPLTY